jgi:hypothetical protein
MHVPKKIHTKIEKVIVQIISNFVLSNHPQVKKTKVRANHVSKPKIKQEHK